ncbi:PTS transporter subunit EIIB [Sphaerisporangium fuscum]|uniref:PTS transporter subunit EIIB n=1 Tax=Sphaerisporangium fuscum TaxID=2835868 RepID=UPI001BDC9062|nr:PTS glucose/sucrose transporter subunit IIB [Sphaerisporangium fuscum]
MAANADAIIAGLGGAANIIEVEPCITRLRTEVRDASKVDQAALRAAGVHGVMAAGNVVQVVVGPDADTIASEIDDIIA